jgi:transposase
MEMGNKLLMGKKELTRSHVMERVEAGEMSLKDASTLLQVGYRQVKRILKRYRAEGAAGETPPYEHG